MSVNVEKIIDEIIEGNIRIEQDNDYRIFLAHGLPNGLCFADGGVIDCLTGNE